MVDPIVLDPAPFSLTFAALSERLRLRANSAAAREARAMLDAALTLARPRAAYAAARVTGNDDEVVELEGVAFRSRVLARKLAGADHAYPCLCTAGAELAAWTSRQPDVLRQFYADAIGEAVLLSAMESLAGRVREEYGLAAVARLSPGSLPDWPLEEQRPLFALLGRAPASIGVTLTDSLMMSPVKSVSGILFAGAERFTNCRLCPKERCSHRHAPYEPGSDV